MPPPSQASRRFWWWARAHPKAAGVKPSVAKEFTDADKPGKLPARVKDGKPVKSRGDKWYGGK
jgi:hypothetical protein